MNAKSFATILEIGDDARKGFDEVETEVRVEVDPSWLSNERQDAALADADEADEECRFERRRNGIVEWRKVGKGSEREEGVECLRKRDMFVNN